MSGRLPFNPRRTAASAAPESAHPPQSDGAVLRVSQIAARISDALERGLPATIRVIGEVSNFRERTHWYFDLKDGQSVIGCVMFASSARRAGQPPSDGTEAVLTGRLEFYAPSGRVSLVASKLEPVGDGALEMAARRLLAEVRALGWTDPERKRPIPRFARRVAVITSRAGAALHDVIDTMRRRSPSTGVLLVDCPMQGVGSADAAARMIRLVNARRDELGIDVIVLTRGGGSAEDLAAFNDRGLARAIVESALPTVAAIGHETDTTIAELVADARAATPTQAAVLVTPDAHALSEELDRRSRRLSSAVNRRLRAAADRLGRAATSRVLRQPGAILEPRSCGLAEQRRRLVAAAGASVAERAARLHRAEVALARSHPVAAAARRSAALSRRIAQSESRLRSAIRAGLGGATVRFSIAERELAAVSPLAVLSRGYSVTLDSAGTAVRSVSDAPPGSRLETRLADGSVSSVVGGGPNRGRAPAGRGKADPTQLDLFRRPE